jgi:hypothetical protein
MADYPTMFNTDGHAIARYAATYAELGRVKQLLVSELTVHEGVPA